MSDGTYAGVRFSKKTLQNIKKIQEELGVPNPLPVEKMHTTVTYSRKPLPYFEPLGEIDPPWESSSNVYLLELWPMRDTGQNCLVLKYSCKDLYLRHRETREEHGATYDFPEFIPHVTLSYDAGNFKVDKSVVQFDDLSNIEIVEEYSEELQSILDKKLEEKLTKKEGEWVLISPNSGRVLRRYGSEKPSEEEVQKDEQEIQYFKHKDD